MKQNKQSKIVAILALFVSILGLTLGFAAFSNTLTISSRATVKPDESDFDINVYGVENWHTDDHLDSSLYTSKNISVPQYSNDINSSLPAKITDNGKTITISDLTIEMIGPGSGINYFVMAKNEGEYDAYIDADLFGKYQIGQTGVCTAGPDATKTLVDQSCEYVQIGSVLMDPDGNRLTKGVHKIETGEYILIDIVVFYKYAIDAPRADGKFSVTFPDIELEFTSVPPTAE